MDHFHSFILNISGNVNNTVTGKLKPTGSYSKYPKIDSNKVSSATAQEFQSHILCYMNSVNLSECDALRCNVNCTSQLEFNVPFQHKYGYIRDEFNCTTYSHVTQTDSLYAHLIACLSNAVNFALIRRCISCTTRSSQYLAGVNL